VSGGLSDKKASALMTRAVAKKLLHRWPSEDKRKPNYATVKPSQAVKEDSQEAAA
jgi:hypothetical protein